MNTGKRFGSHMALLLVGLLMLATSGFLVMAQTEISVEVYEELLSYETESVSVDFKIPQVALAHHLDVQERLNKGWREDVNELVGDVTAQAEDLYEEYGDETSHWFPFVLAGDFQVGYAGKGFLSIPVRYYCFTGGAHGMSYQVVTNISTETGEEFSLADLFLPDYDYSEVIREEVIRQMDATPDIYFQESFVELEITKEQPFYITDEGLVVYFGLYEIAPYSSGIREFTIPFTQLWDGLEPKIRDLSD